MCTITISEYKKHFEKYFKLGQQEPIKVTYRGKVVFTIVPKNQELLSKWEHLYGCLPKEASADTNIDREQMIQ